MHIRSNLLPGCHPNVGMLLRSALNNQQIWFLEQVGFILAFVMTAGGIAACDVYTFSPGEGHSAELTLPVFPHHREKRKSLQGKLTRQTGTSA